MNAKITEKDLVRYVALRDRISDLQREMDKIKVSIVETGGVRVGNLLASVSVSVVERVVDKDTLCSQLGLTTAQAKKRGLIRGTTQTRVDVSVLPQEQED